VRRANRTHLFLSLGLALFMVFEATGICLQANATSSAKEKICQTCGMKNTCQMVCCCVKPLASCGSQGFEKKGLLKLFAPGCSAEDSGIASAGGQIPKWFSVQTIVLSVPQGKTLVVVNCLFRNPSNLKPLTPPPESFFPNA
jgi:hypothetical protein